jgi:glycosyltransferase involved in cell wall biosynthesis
MPTPTPCKLSICISTFNRANFIGATLESIIPQVTAECEVVVLDAASTDHTQHVVEQYAPRCDRLRYIRQTKNNGIDRDYDRAVQFSNGEYCWLMTDDDLFKPDAIAKVLEALDRDLSLILVNVECMDVNMASVLQPSLLEFTDNRVYRPVDMDSLVPDMPLLLTFIGCIVIKRSIWLERAKERYYGSLFIHVGVIFQEKLPRDTLVIAKPLISYRVGNTHTFSPRIFETDLVKWPSVIWSLPLSEVARRRVCRAEPWKSPLTLLRYRAMGVYSEDEYRRWVRPHLRSYVAMLAPRFVAIFPGVLANALFSFYYSLAGRNRGFWREVLRTSRFHMEFGWFRERGTAERRAD